LKIAEDQDFFALNFDLARGSHLKPHDQDPLPGALALFNIAQVDKLQEAQSDSGRSLQKSETRSW
jgi:hypothetical protein